MKFTNAAIAALCLLPWSAEAFTIVSSQHSANGVVLSHRPTSTATISNAIGCACPSCTGIRAVSSSRHGAFCLCSSCHGTNVLSTSTSLFADVMDEAVATDDVVESVPSDIDAMDGVASEDEAHNLERPARKALKKKVPKGKPLSEFSIGDVIQAKVKTLTSYGAFVDIGATTDGLLHISNLAVGFVSDVKEILAEGQDVEVRILNIDEAKNQIALSLLSSAQEEEAKESANNRPRKARQDSNQARQGGGGGQSNRRDDSAVLSALEEKGWDSEMFVEGTVVSTVDFGAFVRVDASLLNGDVAGSFDGLVHISSLASGRVNTVTTVVNVDDKVQVRVKSIADRKVSLSMISATEESDKQSGPGGNDRNEQLADNKEWRQAVANIQQPTFFNAPVVVDLRK